VILDTHTPTASVKSSPHQEAINTLDYSSDDNIQLHYYLDKSSLIRNNIY